MEFVLIASAHFLALLSPGPDFFLIMQASLRLPFRYALGVCAGITAANALYLLFAVLSLEIIRETTWLMAGLKYLGAIYLVFLGVMLLRTPIRSLQQNGPTSFLQVHHFGKQFFIGFMSGILNPKNVIFYLALFTVMVSDNTGFAMRCLYALWMTMVVFVWDCGVVMVIGRDRIRELLGRFIFVIEKVSGVMLTLFGLLLPFT
jgi:threonine/homoserine/homoserine lactone efflux protein